MSLGKPVIQMCLMEDEMKDFAILEAQKSLDISHSEKMMASYMKQTFEKKYKSAWHCVVGRNFGAYVTHEVGRYVYFYIGQKGFLIWSTPS